MSRFHIFNHHSLPFDSSSQAVNAIPDFLKMCLMAKRLGFDTILLDETQDTSWFRIELAEGYFFQDWYNSRGKNEDAIRAFRSIATKSPLFTLDDLGEVLAFFEVKEATSRIDYSTLRAAAWFEGPISSFPTREPWNRTPIAVIIKRMDEDGELSQCSRDIPNWHSLSAIAGMEEALQKERVAAIRSGGDIWAERHSLFPLLEFCGESASQIQSGLHTSTIVHQVRESLRYLNLFMERWRSNEIESYTHDALRSIGMPHRVSGESASVRADPHKRSAREFWLSSGEKVFFENHVKLSSGFRIHFHPDPVARSIHVGHVGRHL